MRSSLQLTWLKDGAELPASNRVTTNYDIPSKTAWIRIDGARPDDSSMYTLLAHNPVGDVRTDAVLNIVPSSTPIDDTAFVPAEAFARIERSANANRSNVPATTGVDDTSFVNPQLFRQFEAPQKQPRTDNLSDEMVVQVPARILVPLKPVQAPESVTVVLDAIVEGSPIPTFTWLKNRVPLSDSNRFVTNYDLPSKRVTLTIKDVRESDTGAYTLLASNGPEVSSSRVATGVTSSFFAVTTIDSDDPDRGRTVDRPIVVHPHGCLQAIGTSAKPTGQSTGASRCRSIVVCFSTGSFCRLRSNSTKSTTAERFRWRRRNASRRHGKDSSAGDPIEKRSTIGCGPRGLTRTNGGHTAASSRCARRNAHCADC